MATKCFCDWCGKEGAMRVMISGASSAPNASISHGPKFDGDLCEACTEDLVNAVQVAIDRWKSSKAKAA